MYGDIAIDKLLLSTLLNIEYNKLEYDEITERWNIKSSLPIHIPQELVKDGELIINFGDVKGNFNCSCNNLKTLKGTPINVGGDFYCYQNQLYSLMGGPKTVGGSYDCSHNNLTNLVGAVLSVTRNFNCSNNKLTSLYGAPIYVGGTFNCSNNKLKNLLHSPSIVIDTFVCYKNELETLKGITKELKSLNCIGNKLINLKYGPIKVTSLYNCSYNKIEKLDGLSNHKMIEFSCRGNKVHSLDGISILAEHIDLSHNKIKNINKSFKTNSSTINLTHNKLEKLININTINDNLVVDIKFNNIKYISDNSFKSIVTTYKTTYNYFKKYNYKYEQ